MTISGYQDLQEVTNDADGAALVRGVRSRDGHRVLVKWISAAHATPAAATRFRNHYELLRSLPIDGIARPLELLIERDYLAIVSNDGGGELLADLLEHRQFDVDATLAIAIDLAQTLSSLHAARVAHLDLRPGTLLVDPERGRVIIADLSVAARARLSTSPPSLAAASAEVLAYRSPEQFGRINRAVDHRSDLYSMGVLLYRLCVGRLPFRASDPLEWAHCHIARAPRAARELVPDLPAALGDIVMKLLAKGAEDRYQSASGLLFDLQQCLAQRNEGGDASPFELATHDRADHLQVAQRLYGREREMAALQAEFERVLVTGASRLVLVSGFAGCGKSSLVHELHRPVLEQRGAFVAAKFELHHRDVPHATLTRVLDELVRQALAGDADDIAAWRRQLEAALGAHGRLIVDLVPKVERLIGSQPELDVVPARDAQRVFHETLRRFLGVFARVDRPLVVFLDDLQWADTATLRVIDHVTRHPDTRHLLIVVAYRDNEVDAGHPLTPWLHEMRRETPGEIHLGPLDRPALTRLVADALHDTAHVVQPLADLVLEKTRGNPFFVAQFLQSLDRDGLLGFDRDTRRWRWDVDRIRALDVTDNVVELLSSQINRLPPLTRDALTMAACIGNAFDLDMLAQLTGSPPAQLAAHLETAANEGLVRRLADGADVPGSHSETRWSWPHARVQQAAYSLIPPAQLPAIHVAIGRCLRERLGSSATGERVFDVANHLDAGATLIVDARERLDVAAINLAAGRLAQATVAYPAAIGYYGAGQALLPDDAWQHHYELAYELHLERARCEWLCGNFGNVESLLDVLKTNARGRVDLAAVHRVGVEMHLTRGEPEAGVRTVLDACATLFGVEFALHPSRAELRDTVERVRHELGEPIADLLRLPRMTDPDMLALVGLISPALPAAYFTDPDLHDMMCCHVVSVSLRYGNSPYSPHGYVSFGRTLGQLCHEWRDARRFATLACDVIDAHGFSVAKPSTYYLVATVTAWVDHIRETLPYLHRALEAAIENGDTNHACYAAMMLVHNRLLRGDALADVAMEAHAQLRYTHDAQYLAIHDAIVGMDRLVRMLRGATREFGSYDDDAFDSATFEAGLQDPGKNRSAEIYYTHRALALYLGDDFPAAVDAAMRAREFVKEASGGLVDGWHFYAALAVAADCDRVTGDQRKKYLDLLQQSHERCRGRRQHCPATFSNRYLLLGAELARLRDADGEAMHLYEKAIASAREHGFVQNEAIANEAAARFYLLRGIEIVAYAYLDAARACYHRWGAEAKVGQLERKYPRLRDGSLVPSAGGVTEQLDVLAIVKATQAVSGEIQLDKLLGTLMRVVIECAGAQRACLVLSRDGELSVAAEAHVEQQAVEVLVLAHDGPLEDVLPATMINFVRNSHETVIQADATAANPYSADAYWYRHRARSVLCMPILRQAKLVGILYLENNLVADAFTRDRVAVLETLAAQAAISLVNAQLYTELQLENVARKHSEEQLGEYRDHLEQLVQERTRELTATNEQLQETSRKVEEAHNQLLQSEKLASIGQLAAGVAHEINNPVGFVMSNLGTMERYLRSLLAIIDAYGRHDDVLAAAGHLAALEQVKSAHELEYLRSDSLALLAESDDGLQRVKRIVQNLKDFSYVDKPHWQLADVHQCIDSTLNIVWHELKYKATVVKDYGELPAIECLPPELNQVFMNMLVNAGHAIDGHGEITIRTRAGTDDVTIEIGDNGRGIRPEILNRIFDPFFTTKPVGTGTGLGLSLSYGIVQKHHGRIDVSSNVGVGTTFRITLPIRARHEA